MYLSQVSFLKKSSTTVLQNLLTSSWGRQSCLQPPFQAALQGYLGIRAERRLKAGGSQDWLPHSYNTVGLAHPLS